MGWGNPKGEATTPRALMYERQWLQGWAYRNLRVGMRPVLIMRTPSRFHTELNSENLSKFAKGLLFLHQHD